MNRFDVPTAVHRDLVSLRGVPVCDALTCGNLFGKFIVTTETSGGLAPVDVGGIRLLQPTAAPLSQEIVPI